MDSKRINSIILVSVIFIGAAAAGYFIYRPDLSRLAVTLNRTRASGDPVLSFRSSSNNPQPGQEFAVSIKLDAGDRKVSAAEIHLKTSSNLEILSTTTNNDSFLPVILPGSSKTMIIVGSEPDKPRTGTDIIAVLNVKALSAGDGQMEFGSDTKVAALYSVGNVLAGSSPLGIFIGDQPQPTSSNSPSSGTLTIQSESLPDAWVNGQYSQSIVVSGGPSEDYAFDVEGTLPPGFSISKGGVINGIVTSVGTFNFKVIVKSGATQIKKTFGIIARIFTGGPNPPPVVGVALPPNNNCSQANCQYEDPNSGSGGDTLNWSNGGMICRSKLASSCPNSHITDDQTKECTRTAGPTADWSYQDNPWYSLYYNCRAYISPAIEWRDNYLTCASAQTGVCPETNPKGCRAYGTEAGASEGGYLRYYNPNNPANCNNDVGPTNPDLKWSNNNITCSANSETACPAKNPDNCGALGGSAKGNDGRYYRYYEDCTGGLTWSSSNLTCSSTKELVCPGKNPDNCNALGPSGYGNNGRWYRYYQDCTGSLAWSSDNLTCSSAKETACPSKNPDNCSALGSSAKGNYDRWYRYYQDCTGRLEWSSNNLICSSGVETACPDKNIDNCRALGSSAKGSDSRWYRYYQNCTGANPPPGDGRDYCSQNPSDSSCNEPPPGSPEYPIPPDLGSGYDACILIKSICYENCSSFGGGPETCVKSCEDVNRTWCPESTTLGEPYSTEVETAITIRAMGTFAGGAYPRIELKMDGELLSVWDVTGDWADYTMTIKGELTGNPRVYFINDYFKRSTMADRNLFVDYITVGRNTYRSDSTSTYASGRYISGSGCSSGFLRTNELDCDDSYFEYSVTRPAGISLDTMVRSWTANLFDTIF